MLSLKNRDSVQQRIFKAIYHLSSRQNGSVILTAILFFSQMLPLVSTLSALQQFLSITTESFQLLENLDWFFFYFTLDEYRINQFYGQINFGITSFIGFHLIAIIYCGLTLDSHRGQQSYTQLQKLKQLYFRFGTYSIKFSSIVISSFLLECIIDSAYNKTFILTGISLIIVLILYSIIYVLQELENENNYCRIRARSKISSRDGLIFILKFCIQTVICTVDISSKNILLVELFGLFLFDLLQIRALIRKKKYLNKRMETFWITTTLFTASMEFIFIISVLVEFKILINNIIYVALTLTLLSTIAIKMYKTDKVVSQLIIREKVRSENEAVIYMFAWIDMAASANKTEQNLLSSLLVSHCKQCVDPSCLCHQLNNENRNQKMKDPKFIIRFIRYQLLKITERFSSSFLVQVVYLNFRINFMGSFCEICHHLTKFQSKKSKRKRSLHEEYMFFQIEQNIKAIINQINRNSKKPSLDKVFDQDQSQQRLLYTIDKINSLGKKKYYYLSQENSNIQIIEDISNKITSHIRVVQHQWIKFNKTSSQNIKILELFYIYFDSIITCRKETAQIRNKVVKKIENITSLKGVTHENIEKHLQSKHACVLQSNLSSSELGVISNIATTCKQIFKISKQKMINTNIHQLMADFLSVPHSAMLRDWINKQTISGVFKDITDVFFVDRKNNSFTGKIHFRLKSLGIDVLAYGLLIKDMSDDIIILNKRLEIEGFSQSLEEREVVSKKHLKCEFYRISNLSIDTFLNLEHNIQKKFTIKNYSEVNTAENDKTQVQSITLIENSLVKEKIDMYLECEANIQKVFMNSVPFYCIKFLEINRKEAYNKTCLSNKLFNKKLTNILINKINLHNNSEETEVLLSHKPEDSNDPSDFQGAIKSSSSYQTIRNLNLTLENFREKMRNRVMNTRLNEDRRYEAVRLIILLVFALVVCSCISEMVLFKTGMDSVSSVLVADGAVSDNNQLFEIIYNRLLMTKVYCHTNSTEDMKRCDYLINTSDEIIDLLYGLIASDISVYIVNQTELSHMQFYSYYDTSVKLQVGNITKDVAVREFIEYFYYALQNIHQKTRKNSSYQEVINSFDFLIHNWKSMKFISHQALSYYEDISSNQLQYLEIYIYCLSNFMIFLLIVPLISMQNFNKYLSLKKISLYQIGNLIKKGKNNKLFHKFNQINDFLTDYRRDNHINQDLYAEKTINVDKYQKSRASYYFNIYHIFFYLCLIAFCLASFFSMINLFPLATDMIVEMNALMNAESFAIEEYIDIKHIYLNYERSAINNEMQQLNSLMQSEPSFSYIAKQEIGIFSEYDSDFQTDFNRILVANVCALTSEKFKNQQYVNCTQNMHNTILQKGLIAGMTGLHRQTFKAFLNHMVTNFSAEYLKTDIFEDYDDYLFFMFKLFQNTQSRMYLGLDISIGYIFNNLIALTIIMISFFIVGVAWWIWAILDVQNKLSNLCGEAIQLPLQVFQDHKKALFVFQRQLDATS